LSHVTEQLVQVAGDLVPILAGLVSSQGNKKSLTGDDVDFVDGFQDQVEDAFLLEQILPVAQSTQFVLLFLVLCEIG
jgi:hypothetical protein